MESNEVKVDKYPILEELKFISEKLRSMYLSPVENVDLPSITMPEILGIAERVRELHDHGKMNAELWRQMHDSRREADIAAKRAEPADHCNPLM